MEKNHKNIAIEQVAAAIAHEVKNPITLVRANIDLLESKDISEEHKRNYDLMRSELDRINDIMMDFIRLMDQKTAIYDIIYMNDLLEDITKKYKLSLKNKIQFEFQCYNEDPSVLGNYNDLTVLFHNIFKNAVEAIDKKGHIKITIRTENEFVLTEIADNGSGIKRGLENKIFENFTTKDKGSGIGLAICEKITTEHNGSFSLKNGINGGCIATVAIPEYHA